MPGRLRGRGFPSILLDLERRRLDQHQSGTWCRGRLAPCESRSGATSEATRASCSARPTGREGQPGLCRDLDPPTESIEESLLGPGTWRQNQAHDSRWPSSLRSGPQGGLGDLEARPAHERATANHRLDRRSDGLRAADPGTEADPWLAIETWPRVRWGIVGPEFHDRRQADRPRPDSGSRASARPRRLVGGRIPPPRRTIGDEPAWRKRGDEIIGRWSNAPSLNDLNNMDTWDSTRSRGRPLRCPRSDRRPARSWRPCSAIAGRSWKTARSSTNSSPNPARAMVHRGGAGTARAVPPVGSVPDPGLGFVGEVEQAEGPGVGRLDRPLVDQHIVPGDRPGRLR